MIFIVNLLGGMALFVMLFVVADIFRVGVISIDKMILSGVLLLIALEFHKLHAWDKAKEEANNGSE